MMEFLNFVLNDPISATLAKTLLHFVWQGALLAVLLFAGLTTISKKHAELRYLLSLCTLGLSLFLPLATFFTLFPQHSAAMAHAATPEIFTLVSVDALASSGWAVETFLPLLTPMWLAGIVYLSLSFAIEISRVRGLPRESVMPADDQVQRLFEHIEQRMGMVRRSQLLVSMKVDVPMVIGWIKPVVLLPFSMVNGLSTEQLEMLLAHELAHVRRQDYLVNLIQTFVEILLFFHPCVRWISNRVRVEREYCCDDMALKCCGDARVYATALADAEVLRHGSIPQLAMAATGGDLKSRVLRIIGRHDCAQKYSETWHGIALAGLLAVGLAGFMFVAHDGLQQRIAAMSGEPEPEVTPQENGVETTPRVALVTELNSASEEFSQNESKEIDTVMETDSRITAVASESETAQPAIELVAAVDVVAETTPVEQPELVAKHNPVTNDFDNTTAQTKAKPASSLASSSTLKQAEHAVVSSMEHTESETPVLEVQPDVEEQVAPAFYAQAEETFYQEQRIYTDPYFRKGLVEDDLLIEVDTGTAANNRPTQRYVNKVSPKAMRTPSPNYPVWAAKRNLEGEVLVSFVVSKSGTVENIHFTGDANKYFKRSVELALRKWRFKPGMINGEKTEMAVNKIFTFSEPDRTLMRVTGSRLARRI